MSIDATPRPDPAALPTGAAPAAAPGRRVVRRWWLLVILLASAVRVWYLAAYAHNPLYDTPIGPDVGEYYRAAEAIRGGEWLWQEATVHGPLYPYVLAGWLSLAGGAVPPVRAIQLGVGLVAAALVILSLRRRFGEPVALAAAALWAVCVPLIHYEAELLAEGTAVLWNAAALALLIWPGAMSAWRAAAIGLLIGLSILTHAAALLPAGLIFAWLAWQVFCGGRRFAVRTMLPALLGVLVLVVPAALYSARLAGGFVLLQETGGLNFYIGNHAGATGIPDVRPGPEWDAMFGRAFRDGGLREGQAHSAYFYRTAWDEIRAAPLRWLRLLVRKAALSVNAQEFTASVPLAALEQEVWLVRWPLIGLVGVGLLLPLALLAARTPLPDRRALGPAWLIVLAYVLAQVIYVAAGRYRAPMLPALIALAGAGWAGLWTSWRASGRAGRLRMTLLALIGAVLAFLPLTPASNNDPAEAAALRAHAHAAHENWPAALAELEQTLGEHPQHGLARFSLAGLLAERGEWARAAEEYRAALAAHPDYAQAYAGLADALIRTTGTLDAARPHYERALQLNPEDSRIRLRYARALLIWEQYAAAAEQYAYILNRRVDPDASRGFGEALLRLHYYAAAEAHLEFAASTAPENPRVLTNLARLRAACPLPELRNEEQALMLAQRAVERSRAADAEALDVLGMALANAAHMREAIQAAEMAAQLAGRKGDQPLREAILARRALYEAGQAFRDPAPPAP